MKRKVALLIVMTMIMSMFAGSVFGIEWESKWSGDFANEISSEASTEVATLYAGQDLEVGKVYIDYLGVNKYHVTYDITEDNWYLKEVHFEAINEGDKAFIMNAKNGNLIPGQFTVKQIFELSEEITTFSFEYNTSSDTDKFAAHAVIGNRDCVINAEAPYGGYVVIDDEQGTRYDGTAVKAARSNSDNVLTYEVGHSENYFYSLGFQDYIDEKPTTAYVVVEFDQPIVNGAGPDIQIIEDTWGLPYPDEKATVYVSNNGIVWTVLGIADNQTPKTSYHTFSNFELPDDWESAKFVKVEDASIISDFTDLSSSQAATLDGYDLNAILALHDNKTCTEYSETAWGYVGEPVRKADGNWSTTFTLLQQ